MNTRILNPNVPADRAEGMERLRTLYSILAGVPDNKLQLHSFVTKASGPRRRPTARSVEHRCGSAACALGWAALYPEFQALGLYLNTGGEVRFRSETDFRAGEDFFALGPDESALFSSYEWTECSDYGKQLAQGLPGFSSDKRMALHRIRRHLEINGVITAERSAELLKIEETM